VHRRARRRDQPYITYIRKRKGKPCIFVHLEIEEVRCVLRRAGYGWRRMGYTKAAPLKAPITGERVFQVAYRLKRRIRGPLAQSTPASALKPGRVQISRVWRCPEKTEPQFLPPHIFTSHNTFPCHVRLKSVFCTFSGRWVSIAVASLENFMGIAFYNYRIKYLPAIKAIGIERKSGKTSVVLDQ
jgi:hypothetical protein